MGAPAGRKPNVARGGEGSKPFVQTGVVPTGPDDELASVPGFLTPQAIEVWQLVMPDLLKMGVFKETDRPFLAEFCRAYALWKQYGDLLTRPGLDLASPEAKVLRTGYAEMHRVVSSISGEFGFSPVARLRLGISKGKATTLAQKLASPG